MDVHELAGGVLCTGIPGPRLDPETASALCRLRPSGVILFRRNFECVEQLRELTRELHGLPSAPLISIDHEGGKVMRLGAPFTQFPPARRIAATGEPEMAYAVGRAMAAELALVGIDLSFAPVLDVSSNPQNPVIGERAFGSDTAGAIAYALPFMRGLQDGGIIPCGKHFPGHGDTDRDSHLELPIVRRPRSELDAIELAPFRAAIDAGIPALMTAHVVYPTLDERNPATLSRRILDDLLRRELGFTGVIVSDDLQMHALDSQGSVATAALLSLRAGVDWLLICNDFKETLRAAEAIVTALENGSLDRAMVTAAATRIRLLPRRPPNTFPTPLPNTDHQALDDRIRSLTAASERTVG